MRTYLGLGSNLGDRRANLSRALEMLARRYLRDLHRSAFINVRI